MSKRMQSIRLEALENLYAHHPYLLIFQKEDWKDYLLLIAEIYDLLEEDQAIMPYESLRSFLFQYFSTQGSQKNPEQKLASFVTMALVELRVLKDRFDHLGHRYIETTREGKDLLKLFEQLLSQRTRYTGIAADTLLMSLNNILMKQNSMSKEEAIRHHRGKIKAYQEDLVRIDKYGVAQAELLSVDHSKEELFQQAEESALHILTAVEDVKLAIEKVRQQLAEDYFQENRSAGQTIHLVVDFYNQLEETPEYRSYSQAFDILSQLEGLGGRFRVRDVDDILQTVVKEEIIQRSTIEKSYLNGFKTRFYRDHQNIHEKRKSQLQLLQQQVQYAITSETKIVEQEVREILRLCYKDKAGALEYFTKQGPLLAIPTEFSWGDVTLNNFEIPIEVPNQKLEFNELSDEEARSLARALLEAEEATIQKTLHRLRDYLTTQESVRLSNYALEWGLTEYYVLSEVELFCEDIQKIDQGMADLTIQTRYGSFVIRNCKNFEFKRQETAC